MITMTYIQNRLSYTYQQRYNLSKIKYYLYNQTKIRYKTESTNTKHIKPFFMLLTHCKI